MGDGEKTYEYEEKEENYIAKLPELWLHKLFLRLLVG